MVISLRNNKTISGLFIGGDLFNHLVIYLSNLRFAEWFTAARFSVQRYDDFQKYQTLIIVSSVVFGNNIDIGKHSMLIYKLSSYNFHLYTFNCCLMSIASLCHFTSGNPQRVEIAVNVDFRVEIGHLLT